jgi:DNA mismatch repair ATPase MutS
MVVQLIKKNFVENNVFLERNGEILVLTQWDESPQS